MVVKPAQARRVLSSRWMFDRRGPKIGCMTSDNSAATTGQVVASAAEVYETFFVPALFAQGLSRPWTWPA